MICPNPFSSLARVVFACELCISQSDAANKIVFLAGAPSHGPNEHEFRAGCLLLAKRLNESGLVVQAEVVLAIGGTPVAATTFAIKSHVFNFTTDQLQLT